MPVAALANVAKVLRLSPEKFEEVVETAARVLKNGEIVALPTDTVYGVSALLEHSDRLYDLKRRSHSKPLGLFLSSAEDIPRYANQTISPQLARQLLPGPVTLIFERNPHLPASFNPDTENVGIRVPDSPFVMALCARLGEPLAQTSANVSGSPTNPVSPKDFQELFSEIDLVVDGGIIGEEGAEGSTIVDLTTPLHYKIIRDGCALRETENILQDSGLRSL